MNILAELRGRFAAALGGLVDDQAAIAELAAMVLPSQEGKFGDYQANCAMPLAKRLGKPPRDVAAALVERLDVAELCEAPEIAGPGFINLTVRDGWLAGVLKHASPDVERMGVERVASPRRFVLDYSSPNVAKPMHVGHIRSTVIGNSLCKVLPTIAGGDDEVIEHRRNLAHVEHHDIRRPVIVRRPRRRHGQLQTPLIGGLVRWN